MEQKLQEYLKKNFVEITWQKRLFDIFGALGMVLILLPFWLAVLLGMVLESLLSADSRGPFFYAEDRVSGGKVFKFYKFRIFKTSAIQNYFKLHGFVQTKALEGNNANITLMGRLLKQIYMDELPQLFNVLKGDMSLVGPRPSNLVVCEENLKTGIYFRYLIRGGMTGPFQVLKDSSEFKDQVAIDMAYIDFCRSHSGWQIVANDLKILWATIMIVLRAKGV